MEDVDLFESAAYIWHMVEPFGVWEIVAAIFRLSMPQKTSFRCAAGF